MDHTFDTHQNHIDSRHHLNTILSNISITWRVASLQLPAKDPQLPAHLVGQVETHIWCIQTHTPSQPKWAYWLGQAKGSISFLAQTPPPSTSHICWVHGSRSVKIKLLLGHADHLWGNYLKALSEGGVPGEAGWGKGLWQPEAFLVTKPDVSTTSSCRSETPTAYTI